MAHNTNGAKEYESRRLITIPSDSSLIAGKIRWRPTHGTEGEVALVYVELIDHKGNILADNLYTFGIRRSEWKGLTNDTIPPILYKLLHSAPTELIFNSHELRETERGHAEGIVEIENVGENPGLFVEVNAEALAGLEINYDDNYFFLPPHERKKIRLRIDSVNGHMTSNLEFTVKAWNSSQQTIDIPIILDTFIH